MSIDTDLGALLSARATDVIERLDVPADLLSNLHSAHRRQRRTRIAGSALGIVAVAAGAGVGVTALADNSPSHPVTASGPTAYQNARFGFSDQIPGQLKAAAAPADGDGLSWHSADGKATLTLSAVNNNNRLTPYKDLLGLTNYYAHDLHAYGPQVSPAGTRVVEAHAQATKTTFFQRDLVLSNVIYSLVWVYPTVDKQKYSRLVSFTVDHFKAGPNRAA